MPIHQLFPEPVYISKLDRALTDTESKTVQQYKKKTYKNVGNTTSTDSYVLENLWLKNLKEDLTKKLKDYFDKIICTNNQIVPYITQSWLNYTETNQFHHHHSHQNSHVSGVFYINADKKVDSITFHKLEIPRMELVTTKYNTFNSISWNFPVKTGDVVLFPSFLPHGVNEKKGNNTRISLSFNTFFRGKIGANDRLTELILK